MCQGSFLPSAGEIVHSKKPSVGIRHRFDFNPHALVAKISSSTGKKVDGRLRRQNSQQPTLSDRASGCRIHRPPSLEETLNPRPYMSRRTVAIAKCDMTPKLDSLALLLFIPLRIEGLLSLRGP